jgi:hypothetical protein
MRHAAHSGGTETVCDSGAYLPELDEDVSEYGVNHMIPWPLVMHAWAHGRTEVDRDGRWWAVYKGWRFALPHKHWCDV